MTKPNYLGAIKTDCTEFDPTGVFHIYYQFRKDGLDHSYYIVPNGFKHYNDGYAMYWSKYVGIVKLITEWAREWSDTSKPIKILNWNYGTRV